MAIQLKALQLPVDSYYLRCKNLNRLDVNSSILNVYQIGSYTYEKRVMLALLRLIASEPLYSNLRTAEQLAYSVSFETFKILNVLGYKIRVDSQETKFTAEYIDERIENFRHILMGIIETMSDEDFNAIKATLTRNKLSDFNGITDEAQHNWTEIHTNQYEFDRRYKEVDCLKTITKAQMLEFYRTHYGNNQRKLSIQIIGNANETNETNANENSSSDGLTYVAFRGQVKGHLITDFITFKNSLPIHPNENSN